MQEAHWRSYRRNLPHLRMRHATYFVTWRLFSGQSDLSPEERSRVVEVLRHFHGCRYELLAYVVMNNHVHVVVTPGEKRTIDDLVHSWKSFSANQLQRQFKRIGTVWLNESFDRIVRDEEELETTVNYVLGNPWKRWPALEAYAWVGMPAAENE
jgi:REP element-mobilizing transposase RayT